MLSTYSRIKTDLLGIGLELREEKCEAFSPKGIQNWGLPIPVRSEGFELLGTPLGTASFVEEHCVESVLVNRVKPLLSKLPMLQDCQSAILLLGYCGVPIVMHLLRTVPPKLVSSMASYHDKEIIDSFESIIGRRLR